MPDAVLGREFPGAKEKAVSREDRLRLTDAVTRASAECGYEAVDIERIALYAGLTLEDFHAHFDGKDDCLFAALDCFLDRLSGHIDEECRAAGNWPEKVKIAIESGFEFVAELEGVCRLFVIDAKRAGPAVIELTSAAIDRGAIHLKQGRLLFPRSAAMPNATEHALLAGVVSIVSAHLLAEEAHLLAGLAPEAVEMVLTPYVGSSKARRLAAA